MVAVEGTENGRPWRLATPLVRLLWECDQRWPQRDTRSDGSIGDGPHQSGVTDLDGDGKITAHDAALKSQHNPDVDGVVHALDIDSDGVDPDEIIAAVKDHPAAWYVIWDRHIYSRTHGWARQLYQGSDPHTGHLHVSTLFNGTGDDSRVPWGLYPVHAPASTTPTKLTTRKALPMLLYAIDKAPATDANKDGQPDELVYRPGRMLPATGKTQLVQLAGGPADEQGDYHDYITAGCGVVHVSADHVRHCGYVLPGDDDYDG